MTIIESPKTRQEFKKIISLNSNKKIYVKYYADWCEPCKRISKQVLDLFEKTQGEKLLILVNVDECDDVAASMKISSLPTIQTFIEGMPEKVVMGSDLNAISKLFYN